MMEVLAGSGGAHESLVERAMREAQPHIAELVGAQARLARRAARSPRTFSANTPGRHLLALAHALGYEKARGVIRKDGMRHKPDRSAAQANFTFGLSQQLKDAVLSGAVPAMATEDAGSPAQQSKLRAAADTVFRSALRDAALGSDAHLREYLPAGSRARIRRTPAPSMEDAGGVRFDGRAADEVRPIQCDTGVLDVVHGSSLFSRGDTQVLCTATLGPRRLALNRMNDLQPFEKPFMLEYSFPPWSTNETGRVGGTNRRMTGHGRLASRAIEGVVPSSLLPVLGPLESSNETESTGTASHGTGKGEGGNIPYPFAVRLHAETTSSDGSSSMATVCGGSLAMVHAGVPIRHLAAGVSIGLVRAPATCAAGSGDGNGDLELDTSLDAMVHFPELVDDAAEGYPSRPSIASSVTGAGARLRAQDPLHRLLRQVTRGQGE